MMDQGHEELLNRVIDGEATPQESAELRRLIASHPELRARHEGLTALVQTLDRVKSVKPPAGLVEEVLRRIAARPAPAAADAGWLEALRAAFARPTGFRYAVTFAVGLALGILGAALAVRYTSFSAMDVGTLTGTILPEAELAELQPASRERLDLAGVRGEATLRAGGGRVLAEIDLASSAAVHLTLEFDAAALAPLVFQQGGAGRDIVLDPQELRVKHAGRGRYSLLLAVKGAKVAPLRLRLESGSERLERTLKASPGGA